MKEGHGIAMTFSTGFLSEILDVTLPEAVRESINVSHMGTVDAMEFIMAALVDYGQLQVQMGFDPTEVIPIHSPMEEVVITFPGSPSPVWTFQGALSNAGAVVPMGDKMTTNVTLKISGKIVVT